MSSRERLMESSQQRLLRRSSCGALAAPRRLSVAGPAAHRKQAAPQQPPAPAPTGYKDTPKQPNGKWLVHDDDRPRPVVVKPGPFVGLPAPADAIVLLGAGQDLTKWQMTQGGGAVTWPIADGVLSSGRGMIRTKRTTSPTTSCTWSSRRRRK